MGEKWANRSAIYNHDCKRDTKNVYGKWARTINVLQATEIWSTK